MALKVVDGVGLLGWQVPVAELWRRYGLVLEGACPHGHGPLERRDRCGWCVECNVGWSVRGERVTMHFAVLAIELEPGRDGGRTDPCEDVRPSNLPPP